MSSLALAASGQWGQMMFLLCSSDLRVGCSPLCALKPCGTGRMGADRAGMGRVPGQQSSDWAYWVWL